MTVIDLVVDPDDPIVPAWCAGQWRDWRRVHGAQGGGGGPPKGQLFSKYEQLFLSENHFA